MKKQETMEIRDKFIKEMVSAQITSNFFVVDMNLFMQSLRNLFELGQRLKELENIKN